MKSKDIKEYVSSTFGGRGGGGDGVRWGKLGMKCRGGAQMPSLVGTGSRAVRRPAECDTGVLSRLDLLFRTRVWK